MKMNVVDDLVIGGKETIYTGNDPTPDGMTFRKIVSIECDLFDFIYCKYHDLDKSCLQRIKNTIEQLVEANSRFKIHTVKACNQVGTQHQNERRIYLGNIRGSQFPWWLSESTLIMRNYYNIFDEIVHRLSMRIMDARRKRRSLQVDTVENTLAGDGNNFKEKEQIMRSPPIDGSAWLGVSSDGNEERFYIRFFRKSHASTVNSRLYEGHIQILNSRSFEKTIEEFILITWIYLFLFFF
uniref:Uncharacterized protein n=1 Tax=Heterorhabditis bacteriophora TaxID=37862 RepID=A0A1I7WLZ0_HETBA